MKKGPVLGPAPMGRGPVLGPVPMGGGLVPGPINCAEKLQVLISTIFSFFRLCREVNLRIMIDDFSWFDCYFTYNVHKVLTAGNNNIFISSLTSPPCLTDIDFNFNYKIGYTMFPN
jgi:hypothetical protein